MKDMIEFKDGDYGIAKLNRGFFSNLIKTKPSSFRMILSHWNEYRTSKLLGKLESKLEEKKEDAINTTFKYDNNGELTNKSEAKMDKLVLGIAKLESKIKVLSRENVPSTYIKSRAIKLKGKMMDNLWYHSKKTYSIGEENYDKVFNNDSFATQAFAGENTVNEASYASDTNEDVIDKKDLFDVINDSFNSVEEEVNSPTEITPDIVRETVGVNEDTYKDTEVVDLPFADTEDSYNESEDIVYDDNNQEEDITKYSTPSSKANLDMFDENGYRKDMFNYVPMTDEEVEKARQNIEKDLYDEVYRNENREQNVREDSIVVPEDAHKVENDNMLDTRLENVDSRSISIDSLSFDNMKESIQMMQNSIEDSERNRQAAEQDAIIASESAKEARRRFEESEKRLQEAYREYQAYCLYLKEKKEAIEKQGKLFNEDANTNRNFIVNQDRKAEANNNLCDCITSLIPEEIRSRGR